MSDPSGPPEGVPERRKYQRVRLYMPGQLFNPVDEQTTDCKVLDLSAGGAAVQCDGNFPNGDKFVLYVTGFGRFEGRVVLHESGVLRLAFTIGESKQNRLKHMLALFVAEGITGITESRKHKREPAIGSGFIVRADGNHLKCDVLDVSLDGVSLRTRARPAVGEIVNLGRSWGKVIRHHEEGVAIQFVQMVPDNKAA
jgi:PilZ domain-containing protein